MAILFSFCVPRLTRSYFARHLSEHRITPPTPPDTGHVVAGKVPWRVIRPRRPLRSPDLNVAGASPELPTIGKAIQVTHLGQKHHSHQRSYT